MLFLGVLQNGLAIMNVSFANQQIANGLALVVATALEAGSAQMAARAGGRRLNRGKSQPATASTAGVIGPKSSS